MITVRELPGLREFVGNARSSGKSIGFVPTMGALHEGHMALVERARAECGFVVVSIFVNPLQFGEGEDFQRYPRRPDKDAQVLEKASVDLLYSPDARDFYAPDFSTGVEVAKVSEGGEGAIRPGHFRGVATVLAKLFLQISPDAAYLGRKDLQQIAVVRRMIRDLDFPIRLVIAETVRESDGLAMSSRNAYLSASERRQASALPRALSEARDRVVDGERDSGALEARARKQLAQAGLSVDYVEVVDCATMRRLPSVEPGTALTAAVRVGKTRLIDNVLLLEE